MDSNDRISLLITSTTNGQKLVLEKRPHIACGLYSMELKVLISYAIINNNIFSEKKFRLWYDKFGHPGMTMMRNIINNSLRHSLNAQKVHIYKEHMCTACSQVILITRPNTTKFGSESPNFVQHIHEDICGLIHPHSRPFKYFMVMMHLHDGCIFVFYP